MPPHTRSKSVVRPARQVTAAVRSLSAPPTPGAEEPSVRAAVLEEETALRICLLEKALKKATDKKRPCESSESGSSLSSMSLSLSSSELSSSESEPRRKNRKNQRKPKKKRVHPSSSSSSSSSRKWRSAAYQH